MSDNQYKTMTCEGIVNSALELIKEDDGNKISGRWLANQSLLNGPDDSEIQPSFKANLIMALSIHNLTTHVNELDSDINKLVEAKTKGQVRQILSEVAPKISNK
ncbi:hypothetical protein [Pantoea dispersa]|jgi:hypothetical protein|uniref:hypothetical protein n=1 Tax=Pantoea dispersa TaxID=59814 RepID=UPI0021F7F4DA|nr:hypothetical protein [Pantoea dispersa]MCW0320189.1 hypothetical protein [Pantoea dispersa]MCW0324925.1 hypothetical protein [Pantoea dispersa]MCW0431347.1 hypothetical protein [Pantoea dispersa]